MSQKIVKIAIPVVIIVVIIAVVAIFLRGFIGAPPQEITTPQTPSTTEESGGGQIPEIPIYSGSETFSPPSYYYQIINIPQEGVTATVYFVKGVKAQDVINWYKNNLKDYEVVEEIGLVEISTPEGNAQWSLIIFKKGNEGIGVWAVSGSATTYEGEQGTVYWVVKGDIDKLTGEIEEEPTTPAETLPTSDQVQGEEPLQRYPGSVMLRYSKDEGFPTIILIDYGTMDEMNQVASWYESTLQSAGWTLESIDSTSEEIRMYFVKTGEEVDVIIDAPDEYRAYTLISIHYSSYGLPSQDLVSGEEPISRYPNSIMLEHSSITVGGMKTISITYGTHDAIDTVADWYSDYLTANDWQIQLEQSTDGSRTIVATKADGMLSLSISPSASGAYTEIEVSLQMPQTS